MERARVKVSPKFQIVIPKAIREELQIESGQQLVMYSLDGSMRLVPHRSVKELRGIAKGMRWKDDYRDVTRTLLNSSSSIPPAGSNTSPKIQRPPPSATTSKRNLRCSSPRSSSTKSTNNSPSYRGKPVADRFHLADLHAENRPARRNQSRSPPPTASLDHRLTP